MSKILTSVKELLGEVVSYPFNGYLLSKTGQHLIINDLNSGSVNVVKLDILDLDSEGTLYYNDQSNQTILLNEYYLHLFDNTSRSLICSFEFDATACEIVSSFFLHNLTLIADNLGYFFAIRYDSESKKFFKSELSSEGIFSYLKRKSIGATLNNTVVSYAYTETEKTYYVYTLNRNLILSCWRLEKNVIENEKLWSLEVSKSAGGKSYVAVFLPQPDTVDSVLLVFEIENGNFSSPKLVIIKNFKVKSEQKNFQRENNASLQSLSEEEFLDFKILETDNALTCFVLFKRDNSPLLNYNVLNLEKKSVSGSILGGGDYWRLVVSPYKPKNSVLHLKESLEFTKAKNIKKFYLDHFFEPFRYSKNVICQGILMFAESSNNFHIGITKYVDVTVAQLITCSLEQLRFNVEELLGDFNSQNKESLDCLHQNCTYFLSLITELDEKESMPLGLTFTNCELFLVNKGSLMAVRNMDECEVLTLNLNDAYLRGISAKTPKSNIGLISIHGDILLDPVEFHQTQLFSNFKGGEHFKRDLVFFGKSLKFLVEGIEDFSFVQQTFNELRYSLSKSRLTDFQTLANDVFYKVFLGEDSTFENFHIVSEFKANLEDVNDLNLLFGIILNIVNAFDKENILKENKDNCAETRLLHHVIFSSCVSIVKSRLELLNWMVLTLIFLSVVSEGETHSGLQKFSIENEILAKAFNLFTAYDIISRVILPERVEKNLVDHTSLFTPQPSEYLVEKVVTLLEFNDPSVVLSCKKLISFIGLARCFENTEVTKQYSPERKKQKKLKVNINRKYNGNNYVKQFSDRNRGFYEFNLNNMVSLRFLKLLDDLTYYNSLQKIFKALPEYEYGSSFNFFRAEVLVNLSLEVESEEEKKEILEESVKYYENGYQNSKHNDSNIDECNFIYSLRHEHNNRILNGSCKDYFKFVAEKFDELGFPDGAIKFAKAAIESLDNYEIPLDLTDESDFTKTEKKKLFVCDCWKIVFENCLKINNFEEAFLAVKSITDANMKRTTLKVFIDELIIAKEFESMCCGRFQFKDFENEVENHLMFKAAICSDFRKNGNFGLDFSEIVKSYEVLYSYLIHKSYFSGAATIMYEYATKLGGVLKYQLANFDVNNEQVAEIFSHQCRAYLASINAMSLLKGEEEEKYIVVKDNDSQMNENKSNGIDILTMHNSINKIITTEDMKKKYHLCLAKLKISKNFSENSDYSHTQNLPNECCLEFLHLGLFEDALKLGKIHDLELDFIFEKFAIYFSNFLTKRKQSFYNNNFVEESLKKHWNQLRLYLNNYDGEESGFRYRKVFVDVLLKNHPTLMLPLWIKESFEKNKPEDLLRIYISYKNIEEALKFLKKLIEKELSFDLEFDSKPKLGKRLLFFNQVERLFELMDNELSSKNDTSGTLSNNTLESGISFDELKALRADLDSHLDKYFLKLRQRGVELIKN
ncbi:hypothetical protein HK099_007291 [Clydaea vesicula]|uniref:Uncharacterized protein n=1 Tax=Clydaea vesicula TaxID=447962 RepID=A0AAD5TWZ3_9FUNG|nr:hypothetical protein HK099_007291 [Clydaea vesicula]